VKNLLELLGKKIQCNCGKIHTIPSVNIVWDRFSNTYFSNKKSLFVADENTANLSNLSGKNVLTLTDPRRVTATVENVDKVLKILGNEDMIVSIGSGSLTDIAKYAAYLSKKEFSCVPTAPSVDGYTSSAAPLMVNGIKQTLDAKTPRTIILDIDILRNCPLDLLRAGIGDISAKVIARFDWLLSHHITGEYICDFFWNNLEDVLFELLKDVNNIFQREKNFVSKLMTAQLISGLNITVAGNSRPASGSEHLISHFLEMVYEARGELPLFHGLQVAMGTYISLHAYEILFEDIPLEKSSDNLEEKKRSLIQLFGPKKAENFLRIYRNKNMVKIANLNKIKKSLEKTYLRFSPLLKNVCKVIDVGELFKNYSRDVIKQAINLSNMLRERYTVLDFLDSSGILKSFSDWIVEKAGR
jgi:glycerol-1-phosphate dehydrogenase [NAD(P)+]